jgi:hypothetical protein
MEEPEEKKVESGQEKKNPCKWCSGQNLEYVYHTIFEECPKHKNHQQILSHLREEGILTEIQYNALDSIQENSVEKQFQCAKSMDGILSKTGWSE